MKRLHMRIAIGAVILLVVGAFWFFEISFGRR